MDQQEEDGPEYGSDGVSEEQEQELEGGIQAPAPAPPRSVGPYRAIYPDYQSARAAKLARVEDAIDSANSREIFDGAPTEPEEQRWYIKGLYDAFNSIETEGDKAIIDKPCKNGRLSQAALKFQSGKYPAWAIEEVCWEIFEKAKVAQMDVRLLESFHEAKFEGVQVHTTFRHRWQAILEACERSKALCKMLLDAPYLERFVSHPTAELKMKLNNKKINAQRDEQNEIGRTFLSKGLGKEEAAVALAHLHPEPDNAFDPYSVRTSVDRAILPATPPVPVRIQPARAAASSVKRRKMIDSDDDDFEDEYLDSAVRSSVRPSGRPRRATLKTPTRSNTNISVMDVTPQSIKAKAPLTEPRGRRLVPIAPLKPQADMDLETEEEYKNIICELLGVVSSHTKIRSYSLEDLRYYARAYNNEFSDSPWTHKEYPACTGIGYSFTDGSGVKFAHFCEVIKSLMPLAAARGDFVDGNLMKNKNMMFNPKFARDREALGATANALGYHVGYPAPVSIKSRGSPGMLAEKDSFSGPSASSAPIPAMGAFQPYRDYYPIQSTYNQSALNYPAYTHSHGSSSYSSIPPSYGSASRGYSHDNSFQQSHVGSQQSFAPPSTYNAGYSFTPQSGGMFDTDLSYAARNSNAYSTSLRGLNRYPDARTSQSAGYSSGLGAPSTGYNTPMIGQTSNNGSDHSMGILNTPHHGSSGDQQYPDPDDCSPQRQQQ